METVSYREFGRRVGKSDTTIRKAVESGVISAAAVQYRASGRPELKFDIALKDWQQNGGGLQADIKNLPPPTSNYQPTKNTGAQNTNKNTTSAPAFHQAPNLKAPPSPQEVEAKNSIIESRKITSQVAAQTAVIELQKLKGSLVKKDDVYKALFDHAQILRNTLENLPDQLIDRILEAGTRSRNEAHQILQTGIKRALEKLTAVPNLDA